MFADSEIKAENPCAV